MMDAITPAPVLERPQRHEDVFSDDKRSKIYDFLLEPGWETGWKSNRARDGLTFLHKHYAGWRSSEKQSYDCQEELKINAPLIFDAWLDVRDKVFAGHTLVRCYANGMAYGMDGSVHLDASAAGNYTAVYYPHQRWSPNWGGETIFYNAKENRVVACMYPKPNSVVVFDGRIPHRANGVTRIFPGVRITLMFKTEKFSWTPNHGPQASYVPDQS